jgi:hypothetical protein
MAPRSLPLSETQPTEEGSIKAHRLEPDEGKLSYPVLRARYEPQYVVSLACAYERVYPGTAGMKPQDVVSS